MSRPFYCLVSSYRTIYITRSCVQVVIIIGEFLVSDVSYLAFAQITPDLLEASHHHGDHQGRNGQSMSDCA